MKVTRNEDGTVTVSVPKSPEVYDPADQALYIEQTVSAEDFREALRRPKSKQDAEEPVA